MRHRKFSRKTLLFALASLMIVCVIFIGLLATDTIHLLRQKNYSKGTNPVEVHNNSINNGPAAPSKGSSTPPSSTPTNLSSGASPSLPSGAFVSFHNPNLSGSPAPNQLQSTCASTPGATCTIEFTNDGVTKSLPDQLIGSSGITTWTWQLQKVGLTQGTWQITAIATLNGQSKSTNDTLGLNVQP